QEGPTTRTELTFSSRSVSRPVAATRFPTCVCRPCGFGGSTSATGVGRFFRKPVRQLRALGASTPSVSLKRNSSPLTLISRHPVSVTGAGPTLLADTDGAGPVAAAATPLPDTLAIAVAAIGAVDFSDAATPLFAGLIV